MDKLFRIDFYPQEWLVGTSMLEPDECGIYVQICGLIYANKGAILNDPEEISRKLKKCSIRKARSIIARLIEIDKIQVHGEFITQRRCELELNLKRTHLELSAKGGRSKAENERQNKKNNKIVSSDGAVSVPTTDPDPTPDPNSEVPLTTTETKKETMVGANKKSQRGSRLPPDWFLPKDYGEWVETAYPHLTGDQIVATAAKFKDYWVSRAGSGAIKLDWFATWRNWVRTDVEGK